MMNVNPKIGVDRDVLASIYWDYDYPLTGQDLYDFVLGRKNISYLDRDQVKARMLMTVGWYRLIDIFGLKELTHLLTDEALKGVWVDDLRKQYAFARKVINRAL